MLEYSTCFMHALIPPCGVDNYDDCYVFKNGSFNECVLQEISSACVHTKPSGIQATGVVSGDRGSKYLTVTSK